VSEADADEQLRRLKNTVMGAANRLALLASDNPDGRQELISVSRVLAEAAQRLERLLALRRNR
jgi:hypothetical protein